MANEQATVQGLGLAISYGLNVETTNGGPILITAFLKG